MSRPVRGCCSLCCVQVENAYFSSLEADRYMTKLDGLVAANDPTTVARYVSDVAAVINSPSVQEALTTPQRRAVCNQSFPSIYHYSHSHTYTTCKIIKTKTGFSFSSL